jgi:hypothetical protein
MFTIMPLEPEKFGLTNVLLGNQVNISIMRPELLCTIKPVDEEIRVSGAGGVQIVKSTGYLQLFYEYIQVRKQRLKLIY